MTSDPPPPPPQWPPHYPHWPPPVPARTSSQAVWSLVLGILSMLCLSILGSIPAIILGVRAMGQISRSHGALGGHGLALAGVITGSVGIITGICGAGGVVRIIRMEVEEVVAAREVKALKEVAAAVREYHADHSPEWPASLDDLTEGEKSYLGPDAVAVIHKARAAGRELTLYRYSFSLDNTPPSLGGLRIPVASLPSKLSEEFFDKVSVGYANGFAESLNDYELEEPLERLESYLLK